MRTVLAAGRRHSVMCDADRTAVATGDNQAGSATFCAGPASSQWPPEMLMLPETLAGHTPSGYERTGQQWPLAGVITGRPRSPDGVRSPRRQPAGERPSGFVPTGQLWLLGAPRKDTAM